MMLKSDELSEVAGAWLKREIWWPVWTRQGASANYRQGADFFSSVAAVIVMSEW